MRLRGKKLDGTDPLGKKIDDNRYTIIGVVKDFHQYSVHVKIAPFYMVLDSGDLKKGGLYSIRIKPGTEETSIRLVNQEFRRFFPGEIVETTPFESDFDPGTKGVLGNTVEIVLCVFDCCNRDCN